MEETHLGVDKSSEINNSKITMKLVFRMENDTHNKVNGKKIYDTLEICLKNLMEEIDRATKEEVNVIA